MTIDKRTETAADLYLGLLQQLLTRTLYDDDPFVPLAPATPLKKLVVAPLLALARKAGVEIGRRVQADLVLREDGRDQPLDAETMVGLRRLENIQEAVRTVVEEDVPGDWLETGVWRGGASIFAAGCFRAYGASDRTIWVADSFQGLPKPTLPQDEADAFWTLRGFAIPAAEVRANFARYNLLDDNVRFLEGWFKDTLPDAPIEELAILRLDGDMYESTMDALALYDKVSGGGYVIVDDYGAHAACRQAITDFRRSRSINEEILEIDYTGVYWRKGH